MKGSYNELPATTQIKNDIMRIDEVESEEQLTTTNPCVILTTNPNEIILPGSSENQGGGTNFGSILETSECISPPGDKISMQERVLVKKTPMEYIPPLHLEMPKKRAS